MDFWCFLVPSSCFSRHSNVVLWRRNQSNNIRCEAAWLARLTYLPACGITLNGRPLGLNYFILLFLFLRLFNFESLEKNYCIRIWHELHNLYKWFGEFIHSKVFSNKKVFFQNGSIENEHQWHLNGTSKLLIF